MKAARPLAVRMLEQKQIGHTVFAFDDGIRSAEDVAATTGMDPARVFKTLVVEHDPPRGRPLLVMAPALKELELRALAAEVGAKKLRMASHRDAERLTGLRVGGIGALALIGKGFPTLIDRSALEHERILVSAGERGFDVEIGVADLMRLTGATPIALRDKGLDSATPAEQ